jgi:c-di-GMP phosphodiesterase Gmr
MVSARIDLQTMEIAGFEAPLDEILVALPALDAHFGDGTSLAVPVSAAQAADPAGMRAFLEQIAGGARPERFVLELTDGEFLHSAAFRHQVVPLFREFGVRASIDAFGTLMYLAVHELKVDRSLIIDVHERRRSQVMLQAMARAARQLGIVVVADGVQTTSELAYLLKATPVDTAQGHLFAPPMPAERLIEERAGILDRLEELAELTAGARARV